MGSKQRSPSSDSSSSSESESESEEEKAASPPPAKKPSLKSTSPKTKPSKSPQPPSSDDEEDEDGEPPVSQKKDQKKKEVSVKKDEKKKEEEGSSDEEDEKQQEEEDEDDEDEGSGNSDEEKQQLSKKLDSMGIVTPAASGRKRQRDPAPSEQEHTETKKPFQRIWGVDDEIKILKAIKTFYSDKGSELLSNTISGAELDAIYSLLKKSLGLEFTRRQLGRKIRDLRMKFHTNASQRKNNTYLKFSNPQQQEIYEFSKKIWRPDKPNLNEAPKSSGKSVKKSKGKLALKVMKDQEKVYVPEGGLWRAVAENGGISWALIQRGLNLVDPGKARALEKRFFQLELARMRHRLQWLDKKEEAIQLVSDGMKKSG